MTPLHAYVQYICIVYAKYQKASVKALVQADFPFDAFPSLPFQDIKEKPKQHGRTDTQMERRTDNVKTVYPHKHKVCRGYKYPTSPALLCRSGKSGTVFPQAFIQTMFQISKVLK